MRKKFGQTRFFYFFLGFAGACMLWPYIRRAPKPRYPRALQEGPPRDIERDAVDEASWESFPGSDAPGWR